MWQCLVATGAGSQLLVGSFHALIGKACQFSGQVLISTVRVPLGFERAGKRTAEFSNIPVRFPPFFRNGEDGCQLDGKRGCGVPVTLALMSHICLGCGHPLRTCRVPVQVSKRSPLKMCMHEMNNPKMSE